MSMIEPAVAIIVACSIVLRPVFTRIFNIARSVLTGSQRSHRSTHGTVHNLSQGVSTKSAGAIRVDELGLTGWDPEEYAVQTHIMSSSAGGSDANSLTGEAENVIHVRTDIRQ
jgi:hypothetical protein